MNSRTDKDLAVAISSLALLRIQAADSMIMGQHRCIAVWLSKMQAQKSLTPRWRLFLGGSSLISTTIFAYKGGQYCNYGSMPLHSHWIIQNARPKIIDAPLTLIFRRWKRSRRWPLCPWRWPILRLWLNAVAQSGDYPWCKTTKSVTRCWRLFLGWRNERDACLFTAIAGI